MSSRLRPSTRNAQPSKPLPTRTPTPLPPGQHIASNELVLVFPAAFDSEEVVPETATEPIRLLTVVLSGLRPRNVSWKGMWIMVECEDLVSSHQISSLNAHLDKLVQSYPKHYGVFSGCTFMLKPLFELSRLWESISFVGEEIVSNNADLTEVTCYLRQMMGQIERVSSQDLIRRDMETITRDQNQVDLPSDFDDNVPEVSFFQNQRRKFILRFQDDKLYEEQNHIQNNPYTNGHTPSHRPRIHVHDSHQEDEHPTVPLHSGVPGDRRRSVSDWIIEKRVEQDRLRGEENLNRARPERVLLEKTASPLAEQPFSPDASSVSSYFSNLPASNSSTSVSSVSVSASKSSSKWANPRESDPILKPTPFSMSSALRKNSFRLMIAGDEKEDEGGSELSDLEDEITYPTVTSPPGLDDFINGKFNLTVDKVAQWIRMRDKAREGKPMQGTLPRFTICDTRTHDFVGGHIRGCVRTPYDGFQDALPEYRQEFNNETDVIFHCMYSSYRGPRCAYYYWKYRRQYERSNRHAPYQRIWVLENGFKKFLGEFVMDKRLVEDFECGYWEEDYFPLTGREFFYVNDWKPPDE